MFDNHGAGTLLAWVNRGTEVLNRDPELRFVRASAETLLITGFVEDRYVKGSARWDKPLRDEYSDVSQYLGRLIAESDFEESFAYGTLSLYVAMDGCEKTLMTTTGRVVAEFKYNVLKQLKMVSVHLAQGLVVTGTSKINGAKAGGFSTTLHVTYPAVNMIFSLLSLLDHADDLSVEKGDEREVVVPEGADCIVDVGLYGSLSVVWADRSVDSIMHEDGPLEILYELQNAPPGRYACTLDHYIEESEHLQLPLEMAELRGYRLLHSSQSRVTPPSGHDWVTPVIGKEPSSRDYNEDTQLQVRLHSGDFLYPLHIDQIAWSAIGLGTVAQYRTSRSTSVSLAELNLARRLLDVVQSLISQRPFLQFSLTYTKNRDWSVTLTDTQNQPHSTKEPISITESSYGPQQVISIALQSMLKYLD